MGQVYIGGLSEGPKYICKPKLIFATQEFLRILYETVPSPLCLKMNYTKNVNSNLINTKVSKRLSELGINGGKGQNVNLRQPLSVRK